MKQPVRLFTVFHLNICFSSIDESRRPEVVEKCYWPLLNLIEQSALCAGVEAPAYTLEVINTIDSAWTAKLCALIAAEKIELIGSGYAQIIGPLVPAEVNSANLRIGNARYRALLGVEPKTALVNEQSYSSGLIASYISAGYSALVMEWNNAARAHPEWPRNLRLAPVQAADQHGRTISMLWNDSIAFQKFQRYAHGEIELEEVTAFLDSQVGQDAAAFCLYGNDVEIFDFRPGRFATEATVRFSEWTRIRQLIDALQQNDRYCFALPRTVLRACPPDSIPRQLETAAFPVLVKKQPKYNLTRWAATGRDDLGINSACWRIFNSLRSEKPQNEERWRELCFLWSSDFRTHITESRWATFSEQLKNATPPNDKVLRTQLRCKALPSGDIRVVRKGHRLSVSLPEIEAEINLQRGLALDCIVFPEVCSDALAGTIPHGTLDDIALSADWYTGNLVLESPGAHKVTDLEPASDVSISETDAGALLVTGTVHTRLGPLRKTLVFGDPPGVVEVTYELQWGSLPHGSLRLGFLTLLPSAFRAEALCFRTHNGGLDFETYHLSDTMVDHGAPVSFLVSASHALGMTNGILDIGDDEKFIRIQVDKGLAALVGMVSHRRVRDSYFCQVQLSAMEFDDTSVASNKAANPTMKICVRYSGHLA